MQIYDILGLLGCIGFCLVIGGIGGSVTAKEIPGWYARLNKPFWTPPNWLFPVAWTVLFALMGGSLWLLWTQTPVSGQRTLALSLFWIQLVVNVTWSPVFFTLHNVRAAMVIIALLFVTIAALIITAMSVAPLAALLQVPYLIWVGYASTINAGVIALNPVSRERA